MIGFLIIAERSHGNSLIDQIEMFQGLCLSMNCLVVFVYIVFVVVVVVVVVVSSYYFRGFA